MNKSSELKKDANKDTKRQTRKAALHQHGIIPEYIQIKEIYQLYTAFTQANLKNQILQEKQARQAAEKDLFTRQSVLSYEEKELKEDVLLIQFKLVDSEYKTCNTFSFVNVPISQFQDTNITTLFEILKKDPGFGLQNNEKP